MDEKEKKELIDKILSVEKDARLSRVSTTVFINKASKEEAAFFLDFLSHPNPALKKIARSIVSQIGVAEAFDIFDKEFDAVVATIKYWPDAATDESHVFSNLIDLLETIFTLAKNLNIKNEKLFLKVDDIFKRTKNADLRFSLIKLMGFMGDRFDFFMHLYGEMSDKERRALYYVYSFVNEPKRMELYQKSLSDERNFDYLVSCLLNFPEGRALIHEELLSFSNYNKQVVLKRLQDDGGKHPDFIDILIKILSDRNRTLGEMATEILKNTVTGEEALRPFVTMIESGYSPDGVAGALEVVSHCVKRHPEDIYLQGLELQSSAKNKNIILEFFIEQLKGKIRCNDELIDKVFPVLMPLFDNYAKDKEELFSSVFQLVPMLKYTNSNSLKAFKKKILQFKKDFDSRLPGPFKNVITEFVVKLNQLVSRFDETEAKLKTISFLFDIDPLKLEASRMLKLKDQLAEIETMDDAIKTRLIDFLVKLIDAPRIDWKIKSTAVELLGEYAGPVLINKLNEIAQNDSSLAVKVNAQKAAKQIEDRSASLLQNVLIIEPLFYIQKKLSEFFKAQAFKVFVLNEIERFQELARAPFRFLVISEAVLTNEEFLQHVFDYLDDNLDAMLIIVTVNPDLLEQFQEIPNVKFLKKPFNDEMLVEAIKV
ncbi:MAG: hypothetical protein ACM3SY_06640 [Candidatus Omnitrophota bacterium]